MIRLVKAVVEVMVHLGRQKMNVQDDAKNGMVIKACLSYVIASRK